MSGRLIAEPWFIDTVTLLDRNPCQLELTGWALLDPAVPIEESAKRFLVNGRAPLHIEYPLSRPDVQKVFWQRQGAEQCGFSIITDAEYPDGVMTVSCADTGTSRVAKGRETWFLPDSAVHSNLPGPDRRYRVIGNRDAEGFLRLGATDAFRIRAAYENVTGKRWEDLTTVLDWGVGCGRVARHLAPILGSRFHGCDIDADNIAWCSANLVGAYKASQLEPPLPYPDNSFDVVYGISVFTHLRESWESRWLAEMHRVLRPGGSILMTVHGQTAIDFAGLDPSNYSALMDRVEREGLVVTSTNDQLDGYVEHPEEYVNVFHSRRHIESVWGKYFADIEQIPGYIFTHDLIVATKR